MFLFYACAFLGLMLGMIELRMLTRSESHTDEEQTLEDMRARAE